LLLNGEPVAGHPVVANRGTTNKLEGKQKEFTDEQGRVRFVVDGAGTWVLRTVCLMPAGEPQEPLWDSYWAAYTLTIPQNK
ncbi:MAG: hypothetical protein HKN21_02080, partial [Candidatus Eisenbacteria bacterium]|nr:hypothetical protein [Candidatus Eisenbacteria bacterium]